MNTKKTTSKRTSRRKRELRATYQSPSQWLIDALTGGEVSSGVTVNEATALNANTVFACVRNLSEDIAKLPLKLYRKVSDREREEASEVPLYNLLAKAPNDEMTKMDFWQAMMVDVLLGGNGYSEIQKNNGGLPVALHKLCRSRVKPERNEAGKIVYRYRKDSGEDVFLPAADVLHIRGIGDGLVGWSIIKLAKESIGMTLAAEKNSASFFGNNSTPSGTLETPGKLDPKAMTNLRESWEKMYGGPDNRGKTAILEQGLKFNPISVTPEDAQFLESRQFQVEEICRWFRMPPHKVGDRTRAQGWSTLEATNADYKTDTLQPWTERIEQEIERKLIPASDKTLYAEHNFDAMLRADTAARGAFYNAQFMIGAISQNEIRRLENRNPIGPEGDTYYVPLNMVPSDIAVKGPQTAAPEAPAPEPKRDDKVMRLKTIEKPYVDLLSEAFRGALTIQRDRVSRHIGKADFRVWAESFYRDHELHVRAAIGGVMESFSASTWAILTQSPMTPTVLDAMNAEINQIASRHVSVSLSEMADAGKVENWLSRADVEAKAELAAVSKLILEKAGDSL
jgi:HK97 family phage portal protein